MSRIHFSATRLNGDRLPGDKPSLGGDEGMRRGILYGTNQGESLAGSADPDLIYARSGDDLVHGRAGSDTIYDGRGNDTISGNAGDDTLSSNLGDDLLNGGDGIDWINFRYIDALRLEYNIAYGGPGISFDLALTTRQDVGAFGRDRVVNVECIFGSLGSDTFFGGAAGDTVVGSSGDDIIDGRDGADSLVGGVGEDTLVGGRGADILECDSGVDDVRDVVLFRSVADSTPGAPDVIRAFRTGADPEADRIDLSAIDADDTLAGDQAFRRVAALSGAGQLAIDRIAGIVSVSTDADADAEMSFLVQGANGARFSLTVGEFIL